MPAFLAKTHGRCHHVAVEAPRSPCPCLALLTALLAATATAQQAKVEQLEPVALVSQAERLLQRKDKEVEGAVLLLWQALGELATRPSSTVNDATTLSARFLLQANDPREADRRRVFTAIAKQQVELATAYRNKKWFDTAATRLTVADALDRETTAKERAALLAALPKAVTTTPKKVEPEKPPAPMPMLQQGNVVRMFGQWTAKEDTLEAPSHDGVGDLHEWITNQRNANQQIVVEFKPATFDTEHNFGIHFGVQLGDTQIIRYEAMCAYDKEHGEYLLRIAHIGTQFTDLGHSWVKTAKAADGFQRLVVQVRDNKVGCQLQGATALQVTAKEAPHGNVGLFVGMKTKPGCAMTFRNFRIEPLPADEPTDDERREAAEAKRQNAISIAVDEAKALLTKKQPEPAAILLRQALGEVQAMSSGVLRDNLAKSIQQMLAQADPLAPRRAKAAQDASASLAVLSNQYAIAGFARAALALALRAADFDPDGQVALVTTAREAVQKWNLEQATKRANELGPPADDGTVLKEWFTNGQLLDSRARPFTHANGGVRLDDVTDTFSTLMAKAGSPALGKASVHARLPGTGAYAGFAFDVVGPHDYSVALLSREKNGVELLIERYSNGKWLPISRRTVLMDAWRLDGWFGIEIEAKPTGVVMKAAGAELTVERARLAAIAPRFGLVAGTNAQQPVTLELRAFAVPK